jgi:hypothetical protein
MLYPVSGKELICESLVLWPSVAYQPQRHAMSTDNVFEYELRHVLRVIISKRLSFNPSRQVLSRESQVQIACAGWHVNDVDGPFLAYAG